jgi:NAD+ synthase (glutamine-hydrolysing)
VKIALGQLDPIVGDLRGNADLVRGAAIAAARAGADLLVVPEMVVCGYPPKDLLLREGFVAACDRVVDTLAAETGRGTGPAILLGHPTARGTPVGRIANAASLLHAGQVAAVRHKSLLPNYDVFDERRYFRPADGTSPIPFAGRLLGVHVCEDAWWGEPDTFHHDDPGADGDPVAALVAGGADVLINLSASPYESDKLDRRLGLLSRHAQRHRLPFVFANQVGGNDDLVFDGRSLVLDRDGRRVLQAAGFAPDLVCFDLDALPPPLTAAHPPRAADLLDALILGLKDYLRKTGFTDCVLGLSGGIDSALAAYVAAQAAGPEHVHGLAMPSRWSSGHSVSDARLLAENLGIGFEIVPIDPMHRAYEAAPVVAEDLSSDPQGLADQNLQARIRGAVVMTRSNRRGWLALATGNKSELAVGYCTLYGDMCGGFAVLCDVLKRDVYAVSRYVNEVREGRPAIPEGTLTKAPSAELAPNQFDQDTLPPYPVLDAILEGLVEREQSVATLSASFPPETVRWVATRLDRNEFKRRQMSPGIKLSRRAFGSGRRMPIAARFDEA